MNKKEIIGTFVFRNDGDGCLTSKYLDANEQSPFVEACKLKEQTGPNDDFCGSYTTVWLEDSGRHVKADLVIEKNTNSAYKVTWKNGKRDNYEGIGMLFGNLLIGAYWG